MKNIFTYCIVSIHLYSASRSAHQPEALPLTRLGGTDAVVLQSNCVRRTSSRSLHSNCLGQLLTYLLNVKINFIPTEGLLYFIIATVRPRPVSFFQWTHRWDPSYLPPPWWVPHQLKT